jgi:hypothetical protein
MSLMRNKIIVRACEILFSNVDYRYKYIKNAIYYEKNWIVWNWFVTLLNKTLFQ